MAHDFIKFPELANSQMGLYYFDSPHKQITENFRGTVFKVVDGDTIRMKTDFRDFDFPVRMLGIDAPEMSEPKGEEVREWLAERIEGKEVDIIVDRKQRVGKWGRLLGKVFIGGLDMGESMLRLGMVTTFEGRNQGEIPNLNKLLNLGQWL